MCGEMSTTQIEETTKRRISKLLVGTVAKYLEREEHRREFEDWYLDKYGSSYQWKKGVTRNESCSQTTK